MLEVAEIQVDTPGRREVLVRTVAAGLCHSDLHFMEGKYKHDTPTVPGGGTSANGKYMSRRCWVHTTTPSTSTTAARTSRSRIVRVYRI